MFKKLFLGLVAASVIGLATPSVADAGHWHRHGGYGYGGGHGYRGGGFYGGRVIRPSFYGPGIYSRPYYGGGFRPGYGGYGGGGFRGGLWLGF